MEGKLIVIEGTDGSGKETQARLLEKKLNELHYPCVRLAFPMYDTPTGKVIAGPYLGKKEACPSYFSEGVGNIDPKIACLYYAADRKYNIDKVLDYIKKGYYVILERYITSSLAYQGSKIDDKEERFNMYQWIDRLEYWLLALPKPDYTIFLHVPYEYAQELRKNKEKKDENFLRRTESCYIELAQLYHWDYVNCIKDEKMRSMEDIHQQILEIVLDNDRKY